MSGPTFTPTPGSDYRLLLLLLLLSLTLSLCCVCMCVVIDTVCMCCDPSVLGLCVCHWACVDVPVRHSYTRTVTHTQSQNTLPTHCYCTL